MRRRDREFLTSISKKGTAKLLTESEQNKTARIQRMQRRRAELKQMKGTSRPR